MNVGLVACCKKKLAESAEARSLYISPLFRKASRYCEAQYDAWFILSAKYGLVAPEQIIAPYDCRLLAQGEAARAAWGRTVLAQIQARGLVKATFYFHAGKAYRKPLASSLKCRFPLKGLGIGRQMAWYV
jgi:hypothetical protein